MAKLVSLEEAADYLGISPDRLVDMRSRNEIAGYRDGNSWKFKQSELDRVKESLAGGGEPADDELDELIDVSGLELEGEGESESILVSEESLGESDRSTSSTVIGKEEDVLGAGESDLQLASESDLTLADQAGQGSAADAVVPGMGDSDLRLADDELISAGADEEESQLELKLDGSADDGDDGDDELVLDDVGSDVTLSSGDSGINLTSPSDSGISLEELGDEDLVEITEDIEAGPDDDFLLTPDEEASVDEEESASQVIALAEEQFEEVSGPEGAVLEEGPEFLEAESLEAEDMTPVAPVAMTRSGADEAEFTGWNITALSVIAFLLILCGVITVDMIRNVWSWQGHGFSALLVDALTSFLQS